MKTFNVKIVIMLCLIIIFLISTSTVYFMELANFEGDDQLFIPIIIALVLTLLRFNNNISEKSKIVEHQKKLKEDGNDEEKIMFTTCPEYWTKTTHKDNVYCHNNFTDIEDNKIVIGSELTDAIDTNIDAEAQASNIGFSFDMKKNENNETTLENPDKTYIPTMRSNAIYPTPKIVVENFEDAADPATENNTLHKHTWTYYAHKDDIKWDGNDEFGKKHSDYKYNDDDHLINVAYWHKHGEEINLIDSEGNPVKTETKKQQSYVSQQYSNDTNWISPYVDTDNKIYAEINLNELNKTKNKCDLVKNLAWVEANNKCGNINKKFDL